MYRRRNLNSTCWPNGHHCDCGNQHSRFVWFSMRCSQLLSWCLPSWYWANCRSKIISGWASIKQSQGESTLMQVYRDIVSTVSRKWRNVDGGRHDQDMQKYSSDHTVVDSLLPWAVERARQLCFFLCAWKYLYCIVINHGPVWAPLTVVDNIIETKGDLSLSKFC